MVVVRTSAAYTDIKEKLSIESNKINTIDGLFMQSKKFSNI